MQTKPLYLENAYTKTWEAKVDEINVNGKNCQAVLDQTAFFPEGGGQPTDKGSIAAANGSIEVERVYLKQDQIIHEGKIHGNVSEGESVTCELDWDRRYRNMQVHTAGHVLHEAVKIFAPDRNPLEAQHGKSAYFIYGGEIPTTLAGRILNKANEIVSQDLPVNTEFVTLDELKRRASWIPPKLPTNKPLRIMWIGDFEPIPDGGTQVRSTGEIAKFADVKITHENGNSRVAYQLEVKDKRSGGIITKPSQPISLTSGKLQNIKSEALGMVMAAQNGEEVERLRVAYLGKRGVLSEMAKELPTLPADKKREIGELFNDVKLAIAEAISAKHVAGRSHSVDVDLTLPGTPIPVGVLHPITATAREMNAIFAYMGFSVADGPEIETDEYNYDRLNLPPDHPARDLQDSIYLKEPDILLRTHTSSVEAHILATHKPPYRFVFPGKSYRYENMNASNHFMFYQYQGLAIGDHITMANLRWVIDSFILKFFGPKRKSRFRCKYYPEVEPGVGVDIDCPFCGQKGCSVCKGRGWMEMLGAGMIHPNILRRVKQNPSKYSGFAWGMGLDRIAMARYNINDIRALYNGDLIYKL